MKKKNPKLKKAVKQSRNNLDKRIASAITKIKNPDKQLLAVQRLAVHGQESNPSRIYYLVQDWAHLLEMRDNPNPTLRKLELEMRERFQAENPNIKPEPSTEERAKENLYDLMMRWDAESIIELGKEMKRETNRKREWKRAYDYDYNRHRRVLLAAGFSTGKAAEIILNRANIEKNWLKKKENEERQIKRIKAAWRKGDE